MKSLRRRLQTDPRTALRDSSFLSLEHLAAVTTIVCRAKRIASKIDISIITNTVRRLAQLAPILHHVHAHWFCIRLFPPRMMEAMSFREYASIEKTRGSISHQNFTPMSRVSDKASVETLKGNK